MWLHENLRILQEDLCVLGEHEMQSSFFVLCRCLCHELESICAINWVRISLLN